MSKQDDLERRLRMLFSVQRFGVVATTIEGHPYTSLVAFTATEDLRSLVFATLRTTQKYINMEKDSRVAMLIDSRANVPSDLSEAVAVTAVGHAQFSDQGRDRWARMHLQRHPYLTDFVSSPDCVFVRVDVARYHVVSRFQKVDVWEVQP